MENIEIYAELYAKIGIDIQVDKSKQVLIAPKFKLTCCDDVILNEKEGCWTCWGCGLVKESRYVTYEPDKQYSDNPRNVGYTVTKYRPYKALTHFREHVRRYIGCRFTDIPDKLIDHLKEFHINTKDHDCYWIVKGHLKTLKKRGTMYPVRFFDKKYRQMITKEYKATKFYKEIFSIIYRLGGVKPKLQKVNIPDLYEDYRTLNNIFESEKKQGIIQRKNMPNHFMFLKLLLENSGYNAYYNIPVLKDEKLCNQIFDIFKLLKSRQKT